MHKYKFSRVASIALFGSAIIHLFQALFAPTFPMLIIFNALMLLLLLEVATRQHRDRKPGFDGVVAAETIVAYGIMSLIFGLAAALAPLFVGLTTVSSFSVGDLKSLAVPFLQGLAAAGFAPFLAIILRNRVSEANEVVDPVGDTADLSKALAALTSEMVTIREAVIELKQSVSTASDVTQAFADSLETETERLRSSLVQSQDQIRAFGASAAEGSGGVSQLADETDRLRASAHGSATLLDALAKLIESVERFVAPGAKAKRK